VTCPLCLCDPGALIAYRWEFVLPLVAPSQNDVAAGNHGGGRWKYKKLRERFEKAIEAALTPAQIKATERAPMLRGGDNPTRRRVTFIRSYTGRQKERDHANLVGGLKLVVDALVNCSVLVDDSPKWFEGHYRQERGAASGLQICVEEFATQGVVP
jgi:hypothetical protein